MPDEMNYETAFNLVKVAMETPIKVGFPYFMHVNQACSIVAVETVKRAGGKPATSPLDLLKIEHDELDDRLDKLNDFILTPGFTMQPHEQRKLLQRQALVMSDYLEALASRLKLLDVAPLAMSADQREQIADQGHTDPVPIARDPELPIPFDDQPGGYDRRGSAGDGVQDRGKYGDLDAGISNRYDPGRRGFDPS